MTYVRVVLETLDYPEIIHLTLSYLMNLPETPELNPIHSRAKRRQSLDMLSRAADIIDSPTPAIYSLADLILTSLSSKSQQTVSTTLRLVSTILRKHYPYSVHTLLKTIPMSSGATARTVGAHNTEMEMLFQMVSDLTAQDNNSAQTYEDHLKDCQVLLESHPCTAKFLGLKTSNGVNESNDQLKMRMHTLSPHDQFLRHLVDLLSAFFSNTEETNLVLTCVIIDLASCAYMCPEGWLFCDPNMYEFPEVSDSDQEDDLGNMEDELAAILGESIADESDTFAEKDHRRLGDIKRARRWPSLTQPSPVVEALLGLVAQVETYRKNFPDLDNKLMKRRRAFEFADEISEAVSSPQIPQQSLISAKPPFLGPFSSGQLIRPSTVLSSSRLHLQPSPEGGDKWDLREGSSKCSSTNEMRYDKTHCNSTVGSGFKGGAEEFTLSHLLTNIMILQVCRTLSTTKFELISHVGVHFGVGGIDTGSRVAVCRRPVWVCNGMKGHFNKQLTRNSIPFPFFFLFLVPDSA